MIRGTKNEGISSQSKDPAVVLATGIRSEAYETVLAGASEAAAVITEKRQIDTPAAFQTTVPSDAFNGTFE